MHLCAAVVIWVLQALLCPVDALATPPPAVAVGCLAENLQYPVFEVVGGFNLNRYGSPLPCQNQCRTFRYTYAAVEQGIYCFCADKVAGLGTSILCSSTCLDGSACGGNGLINVWNIPLTPSSFILIDELNTTVYSTSQVVTIEVNASSSALIHWGDGAITNNTILTHTYLIPGIYTITAALESLPEYSASSKAVTIYENPNVNLTCPEVLTVGTNYTCNFTNVVQGYFYLFNLVIDSPYQTTHTIMAGNLPEPAFKTYGYSIGISPSTTVCSVDNIYLIANSKMTSDGNIIRVRVGATTTFAMNLVALVPACQSGVYCRGKCLAYCSRTCDTAPYCVGYGTCTTSSGSTCPLSYNVNSSAYLVTELLPFSGTASDLDMLIDPPIPVTEGAYLGFITAATIHNDTAVTGGDAVLDGVGNYISTLPYNHDVQILVQNHKTVEMLPSVTCEKAAPVPIATVPTPYTAATASYAHMGTFVINFTITNNASLVESSTTLAPLCQVPITGLSVASEVWVKYLSLTPLPITIAMGSPIFVSANIDGTMVYHYHDDAATLPFSFAPQLNYAMEGLYHLTGVALNNISNVPFSTIVHMVPDITCNWQLQVLCPCYDNELGFNISLTWPAAAHPPWNATVNVTYTASLSSGSQITGTFISTVLETFATFDNSGPGGASGTAKALSLMYHTTAIAKGGNYTVVAHLSNEISACNINKTSVLIEAAIRNVSGIVTWLQGTTEKPGAGVKGDIYIVNLTTLIEPTSLTGVPLQWRVKVLPYDIILSANYTAGMKFNLTVKDEGIVSLIISGYNSVQGWVEGPPINLTFVNKIDGFVLTDDGTIGSVNVTKIVSGTYAALTPVSCLEVDFGDNSTLETYGDPVICARGSPSGEYKGLLVAPMPLGHNYSQEGVYMVSGRAFDASVTLYSQLSVVVADVPCTMPVVSIVDPETTVYMAPTICRSCSFRVETKTDLNCSRSVTVKRYWTIALVDNQTATWLQEVIVENKLGSWNFSFLSVPGLFLNLGYYKLTYTVDVQASQIIALVRSAYTFVNIIPSNLSAVIIKGSIKSLARGYLQNIILEPGLLSVDPDAPNSTFTNVTWFCRTSSETFQLDDEDFPLPSNIQTIPSPLTSQGLTGGGCFGVGPGKLTYNLSTIDFPISSFCSSSGKFVFVVIVSKDTRRAQTSVEIEVTPSPPPQVSISCSNPLLCLSTSYGELINPVLRLSLVGSCLADCGTSHYYKWSVACLPDDTFPVIEEPNCDPNVRGCKQAFGTDLITSMVVITPYLFELNPTVDSFAVRLSIVTADLRIGYSQLTIVKNKPPAKGDCHIDSTANIVLLSNFDIICQNWIDPEDMGIATYNFYYNVYSEDGSVTRTSMASSGQAELSAVFPYGNFSLYVEVVDVLDAYATYYIGNISTVMPEKEQVDAYNVSEKLKFYSDTGNSIMLSMFINAVNSINDNANWTSLNPSVIGNKSVDDLQPLLLALTAITQQQIAAVMSTSIATTIGQINVNCDVLNSAVASIFKNELSSFVLDMQARENILNLIQLMSKNLESINVAAPNLYIPYVKCVINVMTALVVGMNTVIDDVSHVPPGDAQLAGSFDYDIAVPNDPNMQVPDTLEKMQKKNIHEMTRRQAKYQITKMRDVLGSLSAQVLSKMVTGETVATKASSGASVLITKLVEGLKADTVLKVTSDSNSSIILPKGFCPSKSSDSTSVCRNQFGLAFITWPVVTHYYTSSKEFISKQGRIIDIEVRIDDDVIDVSKLSAPIELHIERDRGTLLNEEPTFVNVSENLNSVIPLVYHSFNISAQFSGFLIEINPSVNNENLIMVIHHEKFPIPQDYWLLYSVQNLSYNNGNYTLFVDSKTNNNRTGRFVVGIGKLKGNGSFIYANLDKTFNSNYNIRIIVTGCYYFNITDSTWEGDAALKIIQSERYKTICTTRHLTQFGSGFFPQPNSINFEFTYANLGFVDNSTLYSTFILLVAVYIAMMIWAHYKDKKDVERRGAIPLPDNKLGDKYIYELTFHTGPDSDAPCQSNIFFLLSGDTEESEIRRLPPATRNLYRRYDRNTFVMTTPAPLGPLHYLRVFHDNSGRPPYDSWQLERVVVRDLQLNEQYNFETNSWLALNRGDGEVDRIFQCSNFNEDTTQFTQRMYIQANRGVNQDNMWASMFLRPIGSRYCRKERVTVCAVFLYVSMLLSAMYFNIEGESGYDASVKIGPIPFSSSLLMTGLMVIFINYPLCLALTVIFKRARPKNLKRCRAIESYENQRKLQLIQDGKSIEEADTMCRVETVVGEQRRKVEPIVRCLPWWTRPLAWLLSVVAIIGSALIVFAYGITWGEVTTVKWFSSFFLAFFVSVLISQWIKIILFALFGSLCCTTDLSVEDMDCDEELPYLKIDEQWMDLETISPETTRKVHRVRGVNSDKHYHRILHEELKKDRDMKFVVRGVLMYCGFLLILLIIVNDRTDVNGFLLQKHLRQIFIRESKRDNNIGLKGKTAGHFWNWTRSVILQEIRAQRHYNDDPPYGLIGFMNDQANRVLGYPILRQVRNARFICKPQDVMNKTIKECTGTRGLLIEDYNNYCAGWSSSEDFDGACAYPEFEYQSASSLMTYPTWGKLGTYGGGGYVIKLNLPATDLLSRLMELQRVQWVDKRTRAVFLEFSIYNANVNLFATCSMATEFIEGGGITLKIRFEPIRLLRTSTTYDKLVVLSEILFVVALMFFTIREAMQIRKEKCAYFSQYWNLAELFLLGSSYVAIGMHFYRTYLTQLALDDFNRTKGNSYMRIDSAAVVDQYFMYLLSFIMFVSVLKLIKLLKFNNRINTLALTIGSCWDELSYFFITFGVIFFAFCTLFFFLFMTQLLEFSTPIIAVLTCFSMMLGKFEFEEMKQANALSPLLFFVFSVINSMVLVNIMLSIILKAFGDVKSELSHKDNEYNVVEYVWDKFKMFINQQPNPVHQLYVDRTQRTGAPAIENDEKLPDKVSELVNYINNVYFDGKLDIENALVMKKALEYQKKTRFASDEPRIIFMSD